MIVLSKHSRALPSSPALEEVPDGDEGGRLAAERHRAQRAAAHFLDEVAAAGAAEDRQPVARRPRPSSATLAVTGRVSTLM